MGAHLRDVGPLWRLLEGEEVSLHLKDLHPLHSLVAQTGMEDPQSCGIRKPGELAAGFCQALYRKLADEPEAHTSQLTTELSATGARCANSHELFFGHKPQDMSVREWLTRAVTPFTEQGGCAPILITSFDASSPVLNEILDIEQLLPEPILIRTVVRPGSVKEAAQLLQRCIASVREGNFPAWWPLLQGDDDFGIESWQQLREELGENWQHVCCAMSPFTLQRVFEFIRDQIVVAQHLIGEHDAIGENITVFDAMCYGPDAVACGGERTWNVREHAARIVSLGRPVVHILIGPSKPEWNPAYNRQRVSRALQQLNLHGFAL